MRAKRLGRGLSNLLNRTDGAVDETPLGVESSGSESRAGVERLPVSAIRTNPFQPRTTFAEAALAELRDSIEKHGILQPVVVRRSPAGGFELIVGERRLRAAQSLEMEDVPAVVRDATDEEMQTLALVENLQREDLNAIEKARALRSMLSNFGLTQEEVATRVGKARTTVANILRLLDLPPEIQALVEEGQLTGAHARAVLQAQGVKRRLNLARLAVTRGLSVREVERRARSGPTVGRTRAAAPDPYVVDLEDRLRQTLATRIRLRPGRKGGRIEIQYADADDLDRLLALLGA